MKKIYYTLLLLFFVFWTNITKASHAAGADLTYDYIGNGQYRFTLKFYRDCSGISAPTSPIVSISSASCGINTSLTLTQQGSPVEVTPLCASSSSTCSGGTLPGIQQYIYTGIISLQQCTDWLFTFSESSRNPVSNVIDADFSNLYVEATLNNVLAPTNSSPDFTNYPVPFICANQPFTYSDGVFDVNGNSLSYQLITPRGAATSNVSYASGFSTTYPITTSPANSFNFNASTGQLNFTPNGTQTSIVAVKVTETNSAGQVIGTVIRDMQFTVINCTNNPPSVSPPSAISGTTYNSTTKTFDVCPGTTISFGFTASDADAGQIVTVTAPNISNLPGATLSTTGTNPVNANFNWTVPNTVRGSYTVSFTVKDNACPLNSVQNFTYIINVLGIDITNPDITYCQTAPSSTVNLTTTVTANGGTYLWTPSSGLSANNIANPIATISGSAQYIVQYTLGACSARDTFKVRPFVNTMTITPPAATICSGVSVPLISDFKVDGVSQISYCNYTLNMFDSYGDGWNGCSVDVLVNGSLYGNYTIATGSSGVANLSIPTGATLQLSFSAGSFISEVTFNLKNSAGTILYSGGPSPASGILYTTTTNCPTITYAWSPSAGLSATNISNPIATPTTTTTYTVTATNASGCSATASVTLNVSNGTISVLPVNPSMCKAGDSIQLSTSFIAPSASCGSGGNCSSTNSLTIGSGTTNTGTSSCPLLKKLDTIWTNTKFNE